MITGEVTPDFLGDSPPLEERPNEQRHFSGYESKEQETQRAAP